ncbi:MAG: DUF3108 domain-containing protein [Akkermansiaceae bacterium]|nr:DUF3108 domain-containing protein [Akkermansiaceae bacterium]
MQRVRHRMRACLAPGLFIFALLPVAAAPAWQRELTSAKPGPWPAIKPCVLDYQVSWKGMLDSGRLRIEFEPEHVKKPGLLVVRSTAKSTGAAAALFPHQSHFWSEIDPATLRPRFFHAVETDRRETVTTTVRHLTGRVESRVITRPAGRGAPEDRTQVFRFSPMYDIFSAMLHVRSQKLAPGDRVTLAIHPFDNPYLLRVTVAGREIHNGRKTIRLAVDMRKIDRETQELRPYRKMKRAATLWLSDDEQRVPVELRAAVFIGDVRAVLTN